MIKLKIFKAEFTESKVAFKKVAFLGKWLKPLFSTCKRIALNRQPFFSSVSCCLPSLVKRAQCAHNQAGQTTADRGKNGCLLTLSPYTLC